MHSYNVENHEKQRVREKERKRESTDAKHKNENLSS